MSGIDKVGKPTGPGDGGFLVTDQDLPNDVVFEFILSNYNIDGTLTSRPTDALLSCLMVRISTTSIPSSDNKG